MKPITSSSRLSELAEEAHSNSVRHGFWDIANVWQVMDTNHLPMILATKLALIHSETSEALEIARKAHNWKDLDADKFQEELADVVIRTLDLAEWIGRHTKIDFEAVMINKMNKNKSRSQMHGGKSI